MGVTGPPATLCCTGSCHTATHAPPLTGAYSLMAGPGILRVFAQDPPVPLATPAPLCPSSSASATSLLSLSAFCQQAVCSPPPETPRPSGPGSLLSGLREGHCPSPLHIQLPGHLASCHLEINIDTRGVHGIKFKHVVGLVICFPHPFFFHF